MIAAAAPGSIVCVDGGDYGHVAIRGVHKAKAVIVRPAPESSASIDLELVASSGIRFVGMTISGLLMGSATDISFSHNAFTGIALVQTQITHANIMFDSNHLDGNSASPDGYEGRLTIRGYENTEPVGVTITNNHFGGGCSDGVQVIGDANGVQIGPGNEFTGIKQSGCAPVHADPIQFYGAVGTIVSGNYFHDNGDGTGGVASFDGDGPATVMDNVFVCSCEYPYSVAAYSGRGWVIAHNTFVGGNVRFQSTGSGSPSGNIVRNNLWVGGGLSTDTSDWGTNDHNLNSGAPGIGNLRGTPLFVGGRNPSSYAGYRLAPRSRGKGVASDGGDLGVRVRG